MALRQQYLVVIALVISLGMIAGGSGVESYTAERNAGVNVAPETGPIQISDTVTCDVSQNSVDDKLIIQNKHHSPLSGIQFRVSVPVTESDSITVLPFASPGSTFGGQRQLAPGESTTFKYSQPTSPLPPGGSIGLQVEQKNQTADSIRIQVPSATSPPDIVGKESETVAVSCPSET